MIYDIHAHIIGLKSGEGGNYLCPPSQMNLILRILLRRMLARMESTAGESTGDGIETTLRQWIGESQVDRVVLLALDGVYRQDGAPDWDNTQIIVGNDYVADFAGRDPKLLFGASVHPYRKDALEELDRVVARGACLIKWLPSAQGIAPDDPRCTAFYERMAYHKIPLLTHTGVEHTLAKFSDALNDPKRLVPALRRGVNVIAAHCGTRMYLYERSRFGQWARLALEYPNLYGDISAFGLPLHGWALRRILKDSELCAKVLYGSDFPISAMPLWHVFRLGWRKAVALHRLQNPIEKALRFIKETGLPDAVFSRAGSLLKLPAPTPAAREEAHHEN